MITKFTVPHANALQKELIELLKPFAAKHGLTVQSGGGSITSNLTLTARIKFAIDDPTAKAKAAQDEFVQYCALVGLKPEHFGATFTNRGEAYTIVGLDLKRRKYPIRAATTDGEVRLFTEEVARKLPGYTDRFAEVK